MSENKKQDRGTSREIHDKWSIRKGINAPNSGLYHEVTISGRKEHNFGSMWSVIINGTFCGNYRRKFSERFSKIIQRQYMEVIWTTKECDK